PPLLLFFLLLWHLTPPSCLSLLILSLSLTVFFAHTPSNPAETGKGVLAHLSRRISTDTTARDSRQGPDLPERSAAAGDFILQQCPNLSSPF
ncbi:hypothetical protein ANANG_G00279950, partial [Anguilla anguilla]